MNFAQDDASYCAVTVTVRLSVAEKNVYRREDEERSEEERKKEAA